MTTWYASETDVDVWYTGVHVVRYVLEFVDEELKQLEEFETNDARFVRLLDDHTIMLEVFCICVETCKSSPSFQMAFPDFVSWEVEPFAQFHAGIVNYCQLAVKQYQCFKKNLRFIARIEERARVLASLMRYLRIARSYAHPFARTCTILEFWRANADAALGEDIHLAVGQLAYISDEPLRIYHLHNTPRLWASMKPTTAAATKIPDLSVTGQELSTASWYWELQIVPYELTWANELMDEYQQRLETLVEKDKVFQTFLDDNQQERDCFIGSVESCKRDGSTSWRLNWGVMGSLGCDSKRPMLHRGLVNYCRFAVKQHACFKVNVLHIASQSEQLRVNAAVRRCLETAQLYVGPYYKRDWMLRSWYNKVTAAMADHVMAGFQGPMWIEEEEEEEEEDAAT